MMEVEQGNIRRYCLATVKMGPVFSTAASQALPACLALTCASY